MAPQAPWSPTAHAFAQHQFSHVANFWKQGRPASYRPEALPDGQAELSLTFQLPQASEVVPPPSYGPTVPVLFPNSNIPKGSGSPKKLASRQRKSYRCSVLHRAGLVASFLPPPKNGSLRQAAQACIQGLQAASASSVTTPSAKKRPFSVSSSDKSPSNLPPLAQRVRADIHVEESEVESPEKAQEPPMPCKFSPYSAYFPLCEGLPSFACTSGIYPRANEAKVFEL